ncbi:MAG: hypothetical protein CTY19_15310 [Methylomonas sp.]|nr:MAG: hypothetical protein CTY19_15310 [Methylomonas sp.]
MKVCVLIGVAMGFLCGCSATTVRQSAWPEALSQQAGFSDYYDQDRHNAQLQSQEQYLTWVQRFYQGWELYPTGWNSISRDLTAKIADPALKNTIQTKLQQLGRVIAAEWAKDNAVRRITTRHVAIWGNALQKSAERAEIPEILDRVTDDVDNLLNNRIAADVITENRFYPDADVLNEVN